MSHLLEHSIATAAATAASTGDKLTFCAPFPCFIVRWGCMIPSGTTAVTAGTLVVSLDVAPKNGGTRVDGAVTSGFDTAGGKMTGINIPAGNAKYHEPKQDVSGVVSPGTGVQGRGGMLRLDSGDTAFIEVNTAATGGAGAVWYIEYAQDDAFNAARDTGFVKVAS